MHTYVFVTHAGELEAKAALLACTLRRKLSFGGEIIAAVMEPEERWGKISAASRQLFKRLDVKIAKMHNLIDESYPHGNKIGTLKSIHGPAIFLDSDMMMLRPFVTHHTLHATDASLKTADINTFVRSGGVWASVYKLFDLELPERTYSATISREPMRPYFNAGFIYVKHGNAFAECWIDTSRKIDEASNISGKRPWLDQVALPITFARLGWTVSEASTLLNFPRHLQKFGSELPYIVHYHFPKIIREDSLLTEDVAFYLSQHHELRKIFSLYPDWAALMQ